MTPAAEVALLARLEKILSDEVRRLNEMSKLKSLPALAKDTMAELEVAADSLTQRLNKVKQRGADVFTKWHQELDAAESSVADAENAINQLSNGGPPLGN